eukprot:scaffold183646_cov28-Prasinocladus_malaysianus.AAC.1
MYGHQSICPPVRTTPCLPVRLSARGEIKVTGKRVKELVSLSKSLVKPKIPPRMELYVLGTT